MRLIKSIFVTLCLMTSTVSPAAVLLEHFNQNHQWDEYKLDNYNYYYGSITTGKYAWAFFDFDTVGFFDGTNWQPGFVTSDRIAAFVPGFPVTGKKSIAWMIAGPSIYYFDGKEWKICDPALDSPVEMAASGGYVWVLTQNNWLGVANQSDPTHFKYIKLYGKPVNVLINTWQERGPMVANNDVHPYMFMVLENENHGAALYRFDTQGQMVKIHDISSRHQKLPYFNVVEYKDDLILSDNNKYYAYSSDFGKHWLINKDTVKVITNFEAYGKTVCTYAYYADPQHAQCFDVSKSHTAPVIFTLPDSDQSGGLLSSDATGAWLSIDENLSDKKPRYYRLDPIENKLININIADYFTWMFPLYPLYPQTALSNGRLLVCGLDNQGGISLGYYNNQKWELTPITSAHDCRDPSSSASGGLHYTENDNVWFAFYAGVKNSSAMNFLHKSHSQLSQHITEKVENYAS